MEGTIRTMNTESIMDIIGVAEIRSVKSKL